MNPIVEAQLTAFKNANQVENYTVPDYFEVYTLHCILNGMRGENVDPFDAHLTGNDFGVDGAACFIQGELCQNLDDAKAALANGRNHAVEFHFFQAKTSEHLDYGNISKFLDAVNSFFTDESQIKGQELKDLLSVKHAILSTNLKRNPQLFCWYAVTGAAEVSSEISTMIESQKARLVKLSIFEAVTLECVGAPKLQNGYRSATNAISAAIELRNVITLPEHRSVDQSFIGFAPAREILKLAVADDHINEDSQMSKAVFFDNVRDFNPSSDVNKGIGKALEDGDGSSFIFKNNGITVVAKEISRTSDKFSLSEYQIVNGCQTTNVLFLHRHLIDDVFVPVRLIGSSDRDFVASIIVGTNKQNQVKEDQFWALKPFMKNLEEYAQAQMGDGKIFIERRENQYRDVDVERTRIVKPSELFKAVAGMYLYQPHRAARDFRGIRSEFADRIFLEDHSVELYYVAALADYKYKYAIRNKRIDKSYGIFKYYVLFDLVSKTFSGKNVLSLANKKQQNLATDLRRAVEDEEAFYAHATSVCRRIARMDEIEKADTREQLRDTLRSEAFFKKFKEKQGAFSEGEI